MAKKNSEYFEAFVSMVGLACQAAEQLQKTFQSFNPETLPQERIAMHQIEHQGDEEKHTMMKKLVKEFVTPIEREDIIALGNEIDELIDKIEDVLIRIYMFNIREMRPAALEFADVISRCCSALQVAMQEFPNFQKSDTLHQAIVDVNTLEEEGDALYIDAMRALYTEGGDPVTIVSWSETFDRLEECCDACEHVANVMETVIMKNS